MLTPWLSEISTCEGSLLRRSIMKFYNVFSRGTNVAAEVDQALRCIRIAIVLQTTPSANHVSLSPHETELVANASTS